MNLQDLKPSLSQLTPEEALQLVGRIREERSRAEPHKVARKKKAVARKNKKNLDTQLDLLSEEDLERLLREYS